MLKCPMTVICLLVKNFFDLHNFIGKKFHLARINYLLKITQQPQGKSLEFPYSEEKNNLFEGDHDWDFLHLCSSEY
jgi:hypothetical protein